MSNSFNPASSEAVAKYAIDKTLEGKFLIIIPEAKMKFSIAASSLLPAEMKSKLVYMIQKNKTPL